MSTRSTDFDDPIRIAYRTTAPPFVHLADDDEEAIVEITVLPTTRADLVEILRLIFAAAEERASKAGTPPGARAPRYQHLVRDDRGRITGAVEFPL